MASPLSQGLFRRAIGESGAFFGDTLRPQLRAGAESSGVEFAKARFGTDSIDALREKPAAEVLQAAAEPGAARFVPNIDGYFLPETVEAIFAAGKQSQVGSLVQRRYRGGREATCLGFDHAVATSGSSLGFRIGAKTKPTLAPQDVGW